MSAARRHRALSIFPELKVANFVLLLSVRRTENRINVLLIFLLSDRIFVHPSSCDGFRYNLVGTLVGSSDILY